MYYRRTLEAGWSRASRQFPVLLLTGPRQAGKTTLLRRLGGPRRRYVTLDDPSLRALAASDPALFLQRFPPPVLIDEIQYAPGLLPYLKMEVDAAHQAGAFWLTGSQHFQMMKGLSETLAGRVGIVRLLGFSGRERHRLRLNLPPFLPTKRQLLQREQSASRPGLKAVFHDIWRGGLPPLAASPALDRDLFYSSYLQTYLQRDVRDLAQVGSQESFLRFLKACAARTGQLLNLSDLARDVDVSVPTAKAWLSILVASFQVFLLPPYHSNVTKRLVKAPKLYFLDTGLCAYLTEWSTAETLEAGAMAGAIFETHVLAGILKSYWHRLEEPHVCFYRDGDGREVDFLLARDGELHPVEAKRSGEPRPDWTRHWGTLDRLKVKVGEGGIVCLCRELLPLNARTWAVPAGLI